MHMPPLHPYAWSALLAALTAIAVFDLRERRIPNALILPLTLGGVAYAALTGGGGGALASLGGVVVGAALLYFQFSRGWLGAGDVKLLGAIGAWCGWLGAVYVLLLGSILGGLLAVAALVRLGRGARADVERNLTRFVVSGHLALPEPEYIARSRGVPFGVALALAGALITLTAFGR